MCKIWDPQRICKYRNWEAHLSPELFSTGNWRVRVGAVVRSEMKDLL